MKKFIVLKNTKKNRGLMMRSLKNQKQSTKYIILSLIPTAIHAITAVLDVPNGYLAKGEKAGEVVNAWTDNKWLPVDAVLQKQYLDDITNYTDADSTAARNSAWKIVHDDLKALMRQVQTAADKKPADAIEIIESFKFRVKKVAQHQIQKFAATNGTESGVIDLVAPGGANYTCHDWWFSADGITFVRMQPTVAAHTQIKGLKPDSYVYFQHELINKKGGTGISEVIKIRVK